MKKLLALIAVFAMLTLGVSQNVVAQDDAAAPANQENVEKAADTAVVAETTTAAVVETVETVASDADEVESTSLHAQIKKKFIEGGAGFMSTVLLCLIFGLAIAIERVIYLNLSAIDHKKLLIKVEEALQKGGVDAAKEVCRTTRGPIASIFYQGFDRFDQGVDVVEKSIVSYGSVQMGLLEKGLSWLSLFIGLAPMLGFMGTVIGMISAFDQIQAAGDISPTVVAGGIKIALITTVTGLIVAMILQVFYNYCISKVDSIVNNMEDASVSLLDIIVEHNKKNK
ncbi:MAG: MotA/TolQ/ExbB proton channel family protein [Marinifilaceae bacterium]